MSSGDRQGGRARHARALVVAAGYAIVCVVLLADIAHLGELRATPRIISAQRLVDVAAGIGRARAVNAVVATAAREAGGATVTLEVPEGHRELLAREADEFNGRATATLNTALMAPFIGGRVAVVAYDPVLDQATAAAIEADSASIALPMDVWLVQGTGSAATVRLYTDPARLHLYVLPPGVTGVMGQ